MSEAERKRRSEYKRNRKKWLIIQATAIAFVTLIVIGFVFAHYQVNKTYYIDYIERSDIDYKVMLKENDFYEEEWVEKDKAYVSSLVESIAASFDYSMVMAANGVNYSYAYDITAQLVISDNSTKKVIYDPEFEIKPRREFTKNGNVLSISEEIDIDYVKYNQMAKDFKRAYLLDNISSMLVVRMSLDVSGMCDAFDAENSNKYFVALNVPLDMDTFEINYTASAPNGENRVLACKTAFNRNLFLVLSIVIGVIDLIIIAGMIVFVFITRNEDINYTIKVKRLVSSYRSYIQKINNEFDTEGYQILEISSFSEMLGIRDTIQSPILMSENADQTCTSFIIPTNTKLLYTYVIKVDNYDDIYGAPEEAVGETEPEEEPVEIVSEEEPPVVIAENIDVDELAEAMEAENPELAEIDFVDEIDEEYTPTEEAPGVEVIGVVWPERAHKNKIYRYDPDGEKLNDGDVVLVPTRDAAKGRDVIRKAAVAHGNHIVAPETINRPLKKIIGVVKRKIEKALSGEVNE